MRKQLSVLVFMSFALAATSWGWSQSQSAAKASAQKPLVLKGALLIDGTGKAPIENAVIVIAGGKIQSVGTEGAIAVPADAMVMDVKGKTIIPGLVDSHVHFRTTLAPLFLYWGITTIGDMGNNRGWILAEREAVEQGRLVGPYIMTVGTLLNGPPIPGMAPGPGEVVGYEHFLTGNTQHTYVTDAASIEAAIAEAKKQGVDAIKLYVRMTPAMLKMGAESAHRHGLPALSHYTSANAKTGFFTGTDEILDSGLDAQIHMFGLIKATVPQEIRERIARGENVEAAHLMDTSKLKVLAEKMAERKMFLNPTLAAEWSRFSRYREDFDRAQQEVLGGPLGKVIPEQSRAMYASFFKPYRGEELEEMEEGYHKMGAFVKEFVAAGGKVLAGADSGPGGRAVGLSLHAEMQMLQEIGLTPMQALQAATSWGMEAWGKLKDAGTVEPGKRADLVVLKRNPLEDISATRAIETVIHGGRIVDREALANWAEVYPRPTPLQSGPANLMIQVPFIKEIAPDWISSKAGQKVEIVIRGDNFNKESMVLLNNRLVPAKYYDGHRVGFVVQSEWLPGPGTYPVVVIRPGSGGAVSNQFYLIIRP
ncbi:MAG: amidohydrolase family protein [Acidobacteria bacterium]|nr:amidohydrolase family protein [Acidobacteriota bacterium]